MEATHVGRNKGGGGVIGKLLARRGILSKREQEIRVREQELLQRLATALERFGSDVADEDLRRFREAREQLNGLFLLVIAGEFNSGKSSFINALLGERVLPEGVTPTTDRINILRHGPAVSENLLEAYLLERTHPADVLREINIVDTPGTNAIIRRHEELTRDFVPRSDLVLFVTSADRPFTESERAFLEQIREWGKKIVFIVNKIDILARPEERDQVLRYVEENATGLLGETPELFAVSARQAQEARAGEDGKDHNELWQQSGFSAVEDYLLKTLDQQERVRLKLLNPLNVGLRLASKYKDATFERLKLLAQDVEAIQNIDQQLAIFHQEMLRDFEPRLSRLDVLLGDMERRGMRFFEETIRIGRIKSLMDSEGVKRTFEREVIGETPREIEDEVGRVIDWIVERNLKLWQDISAYIERRQITRHREGMIGDVGSSFNYNRQALLDSVGRVSRDVVGSYNREVESRTIANEIQGTFATTALAQAGAIGLGTLVVTLVSSAAADVTGILLATALAVGGFYVIPRKRRQAKLDFERRIQQLATNLKEVLTRQVHLELEQSTARINEAIAPYRRFVQSQQQQLNEARGELVTTEDALLRLRADIEQR
ncbi:MAG TPA: dynamin family protein [Gemmatimonadales bacterium]|nr:dynamin family protein [Gemmatimonadales bacterium]